jgi:hypothetical protein
MNEQDLALLAFCDELNIKRIHFRSDDYGGGLVFSLIQGLRAAYCGQGSPNGDSDEGMYQWFIEAGGA